MAEFAKALQSQNIWYQAAQYREAEIKLAQHNMGILSSGDAPASKTASMIKDLKQDLAQVSNSAVTGRGAKLLKIFSLNHVHSSAHERDSTIFSQKNIFIFFFQRTKKHLKNGFIPLPQRPR